MKKILLSLLLIFTAIFCFSYSKPKHDDSVTVKGMIRVYGNEPFTFIGIICDSGEQYSLKGDKEVLKELRNTQGKKVQIKGLPEKTEKSEMQNQEKAVLLVPNTLKNGNLNVIEWKLVE